jgi:hypothetical protein
MQPNVFRWYGSIMDSSSLHPWQRPALDLLQFALKTSKSKTPIDQLVSFLLLDVCVETTLRTYLSLPDGMVDSDMKYLIEGSMRAVISMPWQMA